MAVMTPLDFAQRYFSLDAYIFTPEESAKPDYLLAEGWRKLRVVKYHISESSWFSTFWADISNRLPQMVDVRVKTIDGNIDDVSLTQGEAQKHFYWPFLGKGTPEEAQIAIQLVYRYHKTHMPPELFVRQAGFIGLDCNGFVGSYIQRAVNNQSWRKAIKKQWSFGGAGTYIKTLFDGVVKSGGSEMTDLEGMKAEDTYILALCDEFNGTIKDPSPDQPTNYGHVMITEPNSMFPGVPSNSSSRALPLLSVPDRNSTGVFLRVVQASGPMGRGELHDSYYTLHSPSKKSQGTVFTLSAGTWSGRGVGGMKVRVARIKV
jgi:hypothetical protein